MPEWWTYTLGDFLMFAPRTYYRLIERYNAALWPAHLLALALGLAVAGLGLRPGRGRARVAAGTLAVVWVWVAVGFLWQRYGAINWPVRGFAVMFGVQALLLATIGAVPGTVAIGARSPRAPVPGVLLLAIGLAVCPLVAAGSGRGWAQADTFGLTPDPTAIATLGWLFLQDGIGARALQIVPVLWCTFSGLTLVALRDPGAAVPLFAAALTTTAALRATLARRRSRA